MKFNLNKILHDRKTLYTILSIMLVSVFTLTIVYASLSTALNITGSTEISASSWDIHLENVKVKNGSIEADEPEIVGTSTISFDVYLTLPGDFYEFTVDVVNDGSIDAMIDSVVKTPELTTDQAKYIKYEITYENGESITTKQILKKETTTPVKVRIEYRKDLSATDLPSTTDTLSLSLTLIYVQSDGTGSEIKDNGVLKLTTANGSLDAIGTIVTIGSEQFYTIGTEGDDVKLLSMYNLHVGNIYDGNKNVPIENPTGLQDSNMIGCCVSGQTERYGTTNFSDTAYWSSTVSRYPAYVYNSSSTLYKYIENYKSYIEELGVEVNEARPITYEELTSEEIGCNASSNTCTSSDYPWIYSTSYWSASVCDSTRVWRVTSNGDFDRSVRNFAIYYGVRPVIIISKSLF